MVIDPMNNLEDAMSNIEEKERAQSGSGRGPESRDASADRTSIGRVEHFFDKIGVAAIELTGTLRVGDTIEIEGGGDVLRQKIESMQIDRKDVSEASRGDSIGIKTERPVHRGSIVYRL